MPPREAILRVTVCRAGGSVGAVTLSLWLGELCTPKAESSRQGSTCAMV